MNATDLLWASARARAAALADVTALRAGGTDNWDYVAVRDLIAVAVYVIAVRDARPVDAVGLDDALVLLGEPDGYRAAAAAAVRQAGPGSPVADAWAWLTREWDPHAAPGRRWDGLGRGIARALPDPAVDVCLERAAGTVSQALEDQRGALRRRTPVTVTGGPHAGAHGVVDAPSWALDETGRLAEGPPGAYLVLVTTTGGVELRHVLVQDLVVDTPATA